jgi:hypothetical protein
MTALLRQGKKKFAIVSLVFHDWFSYISIYQHNFTLNFKMYQACYLAALIENDV